MIVVTGGLGFIGSHLVTNSFGYSNQPLKICIIDDLSAHNQDKDTFEHLKKIWLSDSSKDIEILWKCIDITHTTKLEKCMNDLPDIDTIYHLAGRKSIKESYQYPSLYESVNYQGSINVFNIGYQCGCRRFVFSSTATVYTGDCPLTGFDENSDCCLDDIPHMYGKSKRKFEIYLNDTFSQQHQDCKIIVLRYFNPVSNSQNGDLLENINTGDNLFPQLARSILHKRNFKLYGLNYPNTKDGSCIRDFIHVIDLVSVHIQMADQVPNGLSIFNVGTGQGETILNIAMLFKNKIEKRGIMWNFDIEPPRQGDRAISFSNIDKLKNAIQWKPAYTIEDMLDHFIKGRSI